MKHKFKTGHGVELRFNAVDSFAWRGAVVETPGVKPDVEVSCSFERRGNGQDNHLEAAIETIEAG